MRKAVLLLSGGLDSAVTLAMARAEGYDVRTLTFDYGQRHVLEVARAGRLAEMADVPNHVIRLATPFGTSSLFGGEVAKDSPAAGRPGTYVPGRNTIMLSYALAAAEAFEAPNIFIGANRLDREGYPDCRPEYMDAFRAVAALATWSLEPIRLHAPLLDLDKSDVVRRGSALGVRFDLTSSCYDPQGAAPCGHCDACLQRQAAFSDAGLIDPLVS